MSLSAFMPFSVEAVEAYELNSRVRNYTECSVSSRDYKVLHICISHVSYVPFGRALMTYLGQVR
jgi:hypothetical protein